MKLSCGYNRWFVGTDTVYMGHFSFVATALFLIMGSRRWTAALPAFRDAFRPMQSAASHPIGSWLA